MGKFKKGAPRPAKAGRKKGSLNKVTVSIKQALVEAFGELGGVPALVKWGRKNPNLFYPLWAKLLPVELKTPDGEPIQLHIVRKVVGANPDAGSGVPPKAS